MLLADYRRELSLSRNYVARLLGVSELVMLKLENGERSPSKTELEKLSLIYGVPESLLAEAETPDPDKLPELRQLQKFKNKFKKSL